MSGHLMLLATVDNELDASLLIDVDIDRRDSLRCAVNHQIRRLKEIIAVPGDIEAGVSHRFRMFPGGPEKAEAFWIAMRGRQSTLISATPVSSISSCRATASATRLPITP